jgi:hypothetical protein
MLLEGIKNVKYEERVTEGEIADCKTKEYLS